MKRKFMLQFTTTQLILLSFLIPIFIGSILLALPISSANGQAVSYIDALFTATTSVCVTGLVTLPTYSAWSPFAQVVILILIQIGGLGIVTIMAGVFLRFEKKIGLGERFLLQDAFNLNSMSGIVRFIKKVLLGTFFVEGIGALICMFVFVPEFGIRGIWISVFHSISAFCNAGMDVIGENSMCNYATNPVIMSVTSALIILGGIGYIVWWDVLSMFKSIKVHKQRCFRILSLHSKIALSSTMILLIGGMISFLLLEYNNPLTIGSYTLFDKMQAAAFQSVTTRTAGFVSIPQENLTNASSILSLLLMFIGGSPVGTAGGIKTVTIAVLIISAYATIRNKEETEIFDRRISKQAINKSVAVVCMSFFIMFISTVLLAAVTDASALDIAYETVSATATVGLSRNLTSRLNMWGKLIIICTMYLGRVGPISLAIAFQTKKESRNIIKNPVEEISVG